MPSFFTKPIKITDLYYFHLHKGLAAKTVWQQAPLKRYCKDYSLVKQSRTTLCFGTVKARSSGGAKGWSQMFAGVSKVL